MLKWNNKLSYLLLLGYLSSTRAHRFYGHAYKAPKNIFSKVMLERFMAGITINYITYEFALESFPKTHDYLYGSGYVTAFVFFIPRSIWPSKPIATGNFVSRLYYKTDNLPNTLGLPPPGELYVNFGLLGIVIGMFVGGKLVRILNTYLQNHSHNHVLWLAWLMIIPDFAAEWRGDFTSMTVQPFLRVSVFLGLTWLVGRIPSLNHEKNNDLPG